MRSDSAAKICLGLVCFASIAFSAEPEASRSCKGSWSVFDPVPDHCLPQIDTDRPHLTDSPVPVPAGHFQLESGILLLETGRPGGAPDRALLLDQMYKIGLVDGVDFQILTVHASHEQRTLSANPRPLTFRSKIVLSGDQDSGAMATLTPILSVPLRSDQAWQAGALLFLAWDLRPGLALEVNGGAWINSAAGSASHTDLMLSSALTTALGGAFSAFGEFFAVRTPSISSTELLFGTGLLWAVKRDLQLDLGTYLGALGEVPSVSPFLGVSIRL